MAYDEFGFTYSNLGDPDEPLRISRGLISYATELASERNLKSLPITVNWSLGEWKRRLDLRDGGPDHFSRRVTSGLVDCGPLPSPFISGVPKSKHDTPNAVCGILTRNCAVRFATVSSLISLTWQGSMPQIGAPECQLSALVIHSAVPRQHAWLL
jgi:hypothetical protein